MTRFQITIRCVACSHRYKRTIEAPDEQSLDDAPDPPCPKCAKVARVAPPYPYAEGKAPAVGGSLVVRATDYTANAMMEDYNMTNVRDFNKVEPGEMAAPKLPPAQQNAVDNFFGGPRNRRNPLGMTSKQIVQTAVRGGFTTRDTVNPVAIHAETKTRAPINIVAGDGVRKN